MLLPVTTFPPAAVLVATAPPTEEMTLEATWEAPLTAELTAEAAALSTAPAIPPEEAYVVDRGQLGSQLTFTKCIQVDPSALTEAVTAPALALASAAWKSGGAVVINTRNAWVFNLVWYLRVKPLGRQQIQQEG